MTVSSVSSKSSVSPSPDRRPSPGQYDGQADACFAFFQDFTVDYLGGLLDRQWKPLIMRAVEQSDALYYAALAMGSIHKTVMSKQSLDIQLDEDKYAIQQYTRALRKMSSASEQTASTPIEIILTACLLFIGFESLRGNHGVVLQHVNSGIGIMRQHFNDSKAMDADRVVPLRNLLPAFARLERQLQELTGSPSPLIQDLAAEQQAAGFFDYGGPEPQPIPSFITLHAAWASLHRRWHSLIAWTGMIHIDWYNHMGDVHKDTNRFATPWEAPPVLQKRHAELSRDFELWKFGLLKLQKELPSLSRKDEVILTLLRCHAVLAQNVLDTASLPREVMWDDFTDQFAEIVSLCRTVVELEVLEAAAARGDVKAQLVVKHRYAPDLEQQNKSSDGPRSLLTFEMSICMILLHVITKCRDARIRLDAIQLLENYPRLEGLWDSAILAKSGRAMDEVERGGRTLEEAAARNAPPSEIAPVKRILDLRAAMHVNSRSGDLVMYTHARIWEPEKTIVNRVIVHW